MWRTEHGEHGDEDKHKNEKLDKKVYVKIRKLYKLDKVR